jgi:phosphoribosylformylglycinamidine cyclo-ligase
MPDAYGAAGVDIDAANETVERYRTIVQPNADPRVLQGLGGFSGCFALQGLRNPILVASTDGVGTKVLVAATLARYDTVGRDLVNHCINDILCSNADPLFFLDYLAMGKLKPDAASAIVRGIAAACDDSNMALLGGETAEMPGVYTPPHFDLAGTIVGALERTAMLDPSTVVAGDVIIGFPANGLHTNGYSLARAVLPPERWHEKVSPESDLTIADALLAVHPSYLRYVRAVQKAGGTIKSMAHITGGGLIHNLPRAFPEQLAARLDARTWEVPPIVALVASLARLEPDESYRTLNMGVGFCIIVDQQAARTALNAARAAIAADPVPFAERQSAAIIGELEARHPCGPSVIIA